MRDGFVDFLVRAKRATYAADGPRSAPSRPRSRDLRYEEGDWLYIDTYLGAARFAGEEAVWYRGEPIWAMNYVGRNVEAGFDTAFLKEALAAVDASMALPVRGPAAYANGPLRYACEQRGDMEWFYGYERIWRGDVLQYECAYHGGALA